MTSTQLTVQRAGAGATFSLEPPAPRAKWVDLPKVLAQLIFSYLHPERESCVASQVCTEWARNRYSMTTRELFAQSGYEAFNSFEFTKERVRQLKVKYANLKVFMLIWTPSPKLTDRILSNIVLSLPQLNAKQLCVFLAPQIQQARHLLKIGLSRKGLQPTSMVFDWPPIRSWTRDQFSPEVTFASESVTDLMFKLLSGGRNTYALGRRQFHELGRNFPSLTGLTIEGHFSNSIDMKALLESLPQLRFLRFGVQIRFLLPEYSAPGSVSFRITNLSFPWRSSDCSNEQEYRDLSLRYVRSIKPHEKLTTLRFEGHVDLEAVHWFIGKMPALLSMTSVIPMHGKLTEEMGDGSIAALRKSSPSTREESKR
ncbi:MAG: F-box protein [Chlamydiales bacterium]|nr:F-box protein [Chlamydiales bacterium]